MTGRMVREYTPDELKKMTSEEITKAIERDLYVNAYEEQKEECIPYTGKNLAHNLETALYRCPECNKIDSLKSEGDRFYCSCGLDLTYNEYGFFTSNTEKEPVFMTVLDWVRWQEAVLAKEIEGIKSYPRIMLFIRIKIKPFGMLRRKKIFSWEKERCYYIMTV